MQYLLLILALIPNLAQPTTLLTLSWNIRDFGKRMNDTEIEYIASIIKDFDLACIQEVVAGPGGAQAVARLADALNRKGAAWDYALSAPTKSSSPQKSERYAVFWKKNKLQIRGEPGLLDELEDAVEREPFMAGFLLEERPLIVWNYHARYYLDRPEEEIQALAQLLLANADVPILLAGDFNAFTDHPVFEPLWQAGFEAAPPRQPSTLKREEPGPGESYLLHPIDYFIFSNRHFRLLGSGYVDLVLERGSLEAAREISDHVPVWARVEYR